MKLTLFDEAESGDFIYPIGFLLEDC